MSKKNKWKIQDAAQPIPIEPEVIEKVASRSVPIDKAVKQLLDKTALRNKIDTGVLVDLAVETMLGSVEGYGYNVMQAVDPSRPATIGDRGDASSITLSEKSMCILNAVGTYFGARVTDVLQDAVMGQRYNWQRMQPVNARSMSSMRVEMFRLEQLGPRA
tara:strand:- start:1160 stop:1639 length:480 start_codon:yes stop_codon:yes gene_type:complete